MKTLRKTIQTAALLFALILSLAPHSCAAQPVRFSVESAAAEAGGTVRVRILMKDSPGIINLRLRASYDTEKLTLAGTEAGSLSGVTFGPMSNTPLVISWTDAIHDAVTGEAVVAVLVFRVSGAASGEAAISLTCEADDVFNSNFDNAPYTLSGGTVAIGGVHGSTQITSVTRTSTGTTARVSGAASGMYIICAAYDAGGRMTGVEILAAGSGDTYTFSIRGEAGVKVFVADAAFRPLCASKSV